MEREQRKEKGGRKGEREACPMWTRRKSPPSMQTDVKSDVEVRGCCAAQALPFQGWQHVIDTWQRLGGNISSVSLFALMFLVETLFLIWITGPLPKLELSADGTQQRLPPTQTVPAPHSSLTLCKRTVSPGDDPDVTASSSYPRAPGTYRRQPPRGSQIRLKLSLSAVT